MFLEIKLLKNLLKLPEESNAKSVLIQISELIKFKEKHSRCENIYVDMIHQIQKIKLQLQKNLNQQLSARIKSQAPNIVISQRHIKVESSTLKSIPKQHRNLSFDYCVSQAIYLPQQLKLVSFLQIERENNRNAVDILQDELNLSKKQNLRLEAQNKMLKRQLEQRKNQNARKSQEPNFKKNK